MEKQKSEMVQFETIVLAGFLRLPQVLKLIPVCKASWWNGCKSGKYPKPYKIGDRVTAWKANEIIDCMKSFPQV